MKIVVRDARPEDAAAIVAIFNPIIEAGVYTSFDTPFSVEAERAYIESMPERAIFHLAERQPDGKIVGFQSMAPIPAYTGAFDHVGAISTFVDLAQRRQGIAGRLFTATFEAARDKGYSKLFTYVRADNPTGLAAYMSQGFRIVGTAQKHARIKGQYVDEIIIEKLL